MYNYSTTTSNVRSKKKTTSISNRLPQVDCGSCLCVPVTSCQWCPGALRPLPSNPSPPSGGDGQPSRVPGCPAHYVDCGTCLCVPPSTCQWCPGGNSPGRPRPPRPNRPVTPVEGGFRPSTVPGCPASYVDCGSCNSAKGINLWGSEWCNHLARKVVEKKWECFKFQLLFSWFENS